MKDNSNIQQAILNIAQSRGVQLKPRQDFDIITQPDSNSFRIIWKTQATTQPTNAELEAEENTIIVSQNKTAYIAQRKNAYPSIPDQLDMLFHGFKAYKALRGSRPEYSVLDPLANVFESWFNQIKAIKDRYPKPWRQKKHNYTSWTTR